MQIGVPLESQAGETRVAATPETVKKLIATGHTVIMQNDAGLAAHFPNSLYTEAGATIGDDKAVFSSQLIFKVAPLTEKELKKTAAGTVVIGALNPSDQSNLDRMNDKKLTAFALEMAPRTSRAQRLDILSSQANIAGYKSVLLGANYYPHLMPMLMTAAGTVKAARVLVLGAGVAGLQAIATAKRLGAVVEASDVRPAVQEQIESLGAKFIQVPLETDEERDAAQGIGGYAKPMPESWMRRQAEAVHKSAKQADIVITTALIPGRIAPTLIPEETVTQMKPGSVIVDLAASQGGNCPLTEADQVVEKHGVTLVGFTNLPALVPTDSSALYARNLLAFLELIVNDDGQIALNREDDIVEACLVCHDGQISHA